MSEGGLVRTGVGAAKVSNFEPKTVERRTASPTSTVDLDYREKTRRATIVNRECGCGVARSPMDANCRPERQAAVARDRCGFNYLLINAAGATGTSSGVSDGVETARSGAERGRNEAYSV